MEGDFIGDCFSLFSASEDERSPEIYRVWSAISLLAAALERRVTIRTGRWQTLPNLFIFLVGGPGTGKGILSTVRRMVKRVEDPKGAKVFYTSSNNVTKSSLVDEMAGARRELVLPSGASFSYSALYTCSEEFGSFMGKNDTELIFLMNELYNCDENYDESRRGYKKDEDRVNGRLGIENPTYNFIGGVQPGVLGSLFPEEHWSSGLARRVIMVFSDEDRVIDPFGEFSNKSKVRPEHLLAQLEALSRLHGVVKWEDDAAEAYRLWHLSGQEPKPQHSRLLGYSKERSRNITKLAGLSAISRTHALGPITKVDYLRAMTWMIEMEKKLPDIFRAMTGKSDYALIEDLWMFVVRENVLRHGKGVPDDEVVKFIGERTTSEKINQVIDLAKRMNKIRQRPLSSSWESTGKSEHKVE